MDRPTSAGQKRYLLIADQMTEYPRKDTVAMMNPARYVLGQLARLKRDSLRQLLGFLHFRHIRSILNFVRWGLDNRVEQELSFAVLATLSQSLHSQVFLHSETKRNLDMICKRAGNLLKKQRELVLTNQAALKLMLRELDFLKKD